MAKKTFGSNHRLLAWITVLPLVVITASGILLQVKNWIPWIQPKAYKGSVTEPKVELQTILKAVSSVPEAKTLSWSDIRAIDIRPSRGVARVRTRSEYEISVDLGTGAVLQAAPRRTGFIIQIHDGSIFGELIQYGIYFPSALLTLALIGTGVTLLVKKPATRKGKKKHVAVR